MARVFVAMSGGVDSSVSAAVLLEQGHEVTGVTMQLWPSGDDEGGCCSIAAVRDARRVCDFLGIPHYVLNFRESFERTVVRPFAEEYARGRTPNPCIVCNDVVKFGDLLHRVELQGADALATGHYARIVTVESGRCALARGLDPDKDQSYFLYRMTLDQLDRVMFPVGEMRKAEVRAFALRLGLSVAEKPDSQETCFAPDGDYGPVLAAHAPEALLAGEMVDCDGNVLGAHQGLGRYTVGQRKGLGLGGGEARYVVRLESDTNRVIVGEREALSARSLVAELPVWNGGSEEDVDVMVRYRMIPVPGRATLDEGVLTVDLTTPVEAVAPGQSVVCYRGDIVLGGGVITCAS